MKTPVKTAVILFNLGGPSQAETIRPFLYNFFMDPNIIAAPLPVRWLLAKYISWKRGNNEAKTAYGLLGGKSPLLENTLDQAAALQKTLDERCAADDEVRVFVSMRYWHPMADEVARSVAAFAPDDIVLLPLYPQYSTATTKSSFETWHKAARKAGITAATREVCCYPEDNGFIAASADNIRKALAAAPQNTRLLFSAHGLPEKTITGGDPYQWQCEETARVIVDALDMPGLDWEICYQSRVGPMKWIGPSTDESIEKAAREGKNIIIYPHAFVSEHVETLVEIEMEYRHKAEELGVGYFGRVDTVQTHPLFINGLADLVRTGKLCRSCPPQHRKCGFKQQEKTSCNHS